MKLAGKVALVTGAARGIGRGIARGIALALAGESVHVAAADPGRPRVRALVRQTTPLGREQTPEAIGEAVVDLCRAENVTGIALNVAGGVEMH